MNTLANYNLERAERDVSRLAGLLEAKVAEYVRARNETTELELQRSRPQRTEQQNVQRLSTASNGHGGTVDGTAADELERRLRDAKSTEERHSQEVESIKARLEKYGNLTHEYTRQHEHHNLPVLQQKRSQLYGQAQKSSYDSAIATTYAEVHRGKRLSRRIQDAIGRIAAAAGGSAPTVFDNALDAYTAVVRGASTLARPSQGHYVDDTITLLDRYADPQGVTPPDYPVPGLGAQGARNGNGLSEKLANGRAYETAHRRRVYRISLPPTYDRLLRSDYGPSDGQGRYLTDTAPSHRYSH